LGGPHLSLFWVQQDQGGNVKRSALGEFTPAWRMLEWKLRMWKASFSSCTWIWLSLSHLFMKWSANDRQRVVWIKLHSCHRMRHEVSSREKHFEKMFTQSLQQVPRHWAMIAITSSPLHSLLHYSNLQDTLK